MKVAGWKTAVIAQLAGSHRRGVDDLLHSWPAQPAVASDDASG